MIHQLTTYADFQTNIENSPWLLVYCSASWCGPCQAFSPIVKQVSYSFNHLLTTVKVDVERMPKAVEEYGLKSVPTLLLLGNGSVVSRAIGAKSLPELTQWLTHQMKIYSSTTL